MNNAEPNQKLYAFVRRWCASASLAIGGVNLADCMAYDVLSVVGRQIVNSLDAPAGVPAVVPAETAASVLPEEAPHG